MATCVIPENEPGRLAAVRRYDVLDSPPDGAFERITALAARLYGVPIAIVSIVDTDRIWFKSHHGLEIDHVDRDAGLCASAILHDGPWLVPDARTDPRTLTNPLVAGAFGLGFYAGVPLTTHDGFNLGMLCVLGHEPRHVTDSELRTLTDLASLVMDELELRRSAHQAVTQEAELRRHAEDAARSLQENLLPADIPAVGGLDLAARYHVASRDQVGGDFYDIVPCGTTCAVVVGDVCGKGIAAASLTGTARAALRTVMLDEWTPADALTRLNLMLVHAREVPDRYCTVAVASITPEPSGGAAVILALGGHPHPLVVRHDGTVEAWGKTAPLVGWTAEAAFTETTARLGPGDTLVLFTDGLLEAVAGHGETDDTALRRLLGPLAGRAADDVADGLDTALGTVEQRDDAAFLIVRAG